MFPGARSVARAFLAALILIAVSPAKALDSPAIAAARVYFTAFDNGDFAAAYDRFSSSAKAVIPYSAWLETTKASHQATQRQFDKTVVYETSNGRLVAVEFEGLNGNGDRLCGFVIVDSDAHIVRVEINVVLADPPSEIGQQIPTPLGCD